MNIAVSYHKWIVSNINRFDRNLYVFAGFIGSSIVEFYEKALFRLKTSRDLAVKTLV